MDYPSDYECFLNGRARLLLEVAEVENDPELKDAFIMRLQEIQAQSLALQLQRKQLVLMSFGIPLQA